MAIWKWLTGDVKPARQAAVPPGHAEMIAELERRNAEADQKDQDALRKMAADQQEASRQAERAAAERQAWLAAIGHRLDGAWTAVAAVIDGAERPDLRGEQLVFNAHAVHFGTQYPGSVGGYEQDPTTIPGRLVFRGHDPARLPPYFPVRDAKLTGPGFAPDVNLVISQLVAVYAIQGESLWVCGMGHDLQWPDDLAAPAGSGRFLIQYRRTGPVVPPADSPGG